MYISAAIIVWSCLLSSPHSVDESELKLEDIEKELETQAEADKRDSGNSESGQSDETDSGEIVVDDLETADTDGTHLLPHPLSPTDPPLTLSPLDPPSPAFLTALPLDNLRANFLTQLIAW